MAHAANSLGIWVTRHLKDLSQTCPKSCYQPSNGQCADVKVVPVVQREPSVIKSFLDPDSPVRRQLDLLKACPTWAPVPIVKCCNLCDAQKAKYPTNLCSAECRPLSTLLHTQELSILPRAKPTYKHCFRLDDETLVGRVYPMKFRIRRKACTCRECKKGLSVRETVTGNEDLILLTSCCNVEVYPRKQIDSWHLVPVSTITGQKHFSKKIINEICKLEPKPIPRPPPVPEPPKHSIAPQKKKKKKKKKGKKGKGKGKNKKK